MKKVIVAGIIVVLVLVTVFFAVSGHLRIKYPEYYNLDTFKGIEVYVWQNDDGEYRCGALSGTNRGKLNEIHNAGEISRCPDTGSCDRNTEYRA